MTPDTAEVPPTPLRRPWATAAVMVVCISIFLAHLFEGDQGSWSSVEKFGYLPPGDVWDGGYRALITTAFIHFEIWHIAFNLYWVWALGRLLEHVIGPVKYLAFFLVSAWVSSSFQLAASDDTGIGASGVVYAIFGFMWLTRHKYPLFKEAITPQTVQLFLFWLVGCVVASVLKIWSVGNAAHVSGLVFGAAVAGAFALHVRPGLVRAGLVAMTVLSVVFLFWCPWSLTWLGHMAYKAHAADRYAVALVRYTKVIARDPDNSWAYLNRSFVHEAMGDMTKARLDFERAREIDPAIEDK